MSSLSELGQRRSDKIRDVNETISRLDKERLTLDNFASFLADITDLGDQLDDILCLLADSRSKAHDWIHEKETHTVELGEQTTNSHVDIDNYYDEHERETERIRSIVESKRQVVIQKAERMKECKDLYDELNESLRAFHSDVALIHERLIQYAFDDLEQAYCRNYISSAVRHLTTVNDLAYKMAAGHYCHFTVKLSNGQQSNCPATEAEIGAWIEYLTAYLNMFIVRLNKCIGTSHRITQGTLVYHEGKLHNGHSLGKHCGQSARDLAQRLERQSSIPAASTFYSRERAEWAVSTVLEQARATITDWLQSSGNKFAIKENVGENIGAVLRRGYSHPVPTSGVFVLLVRDNDSAARYYITTAYPQIL